MKTLRARLTAWYITILSGALVLFAILLYAWLARTMYAHHDRELEEDAARVAREVKGAAAPLAALAQLDTAQRVGPLLMVRDARGATLFRSSRLPASDIGEHAVLQHAAMRGATDAQFFTVRLETGAVRFICLPLPTPTRTYLQLGRPLGDVDALLRVVLIASLSLIPVVVLLTSYGGMFIARRALAPIGSIAATLESIQAIDLSRRVDVAAGDAEISRLTASVNRLLDRVQRAFASLREFTADVSHQMQTPLAVMKTSVDVVLTSPRPPNEYERTLEDLGTELDALAATVRDVREFALTDVEANDHRRERVDLSAVYNESVELLGIIAEERGVTSVAAAPAPAHVWGNRVRLRHLILNLGENAIKYTAPGGNVRFKLITDEAETVLSITDTGTGIPADALPHVFERRYRAGSAASAGGSGLGLALAKRTVEAHAGTIDIRSEPGCGTTVTVRLPLAEHGQESDATQKSSPAPVEERQRRRL